MTSDRRRAATDDDRVDVDGGRLDHRPVQGLGELIEGAQAACGWARRMDAVAGRLCAHEFQDPARAAKSSPRRHPRQRAQRTDDPPTRHRPVLRGRPEPLTAGCRSGRRLSGRAGAVRSAREPVRMGARFIGVVRERVFFDAAVGARLGARGASGVDGAGRRRRAGFVGVLCRLSRRRSWSSGA